MFDPNEEVEKDSYEFEFELLNSEDERIITLVCHSDRIMDPQEYADALRSFADRIDSIATMADVSGQSLN